MTAATPGRRAWLRIGGIGCSDVSGSFHAARPALASGRGGRFISPVGVTLKDGELEILADPCGGSEVLSVAVFDSTADSAFTKKDQVIWTVRLPLDALTASRTERITLGRVPAGFEELTPLKKDDGDELVVEVNSHQLGFDRSELVEGQVLTELGLRTEEQFFEEFVELPRVCPYGQSEPPPIRTP